MKTLLRSYEEYLASVTEDESIRLGIKLGKARKRKEISQKDNQALVEIMQNARRSNSKILLLCVFLLLGIFMIAVSISVIFAFERRELAYLWGGMIVPLMAIVRSLQRLWYEKSMMDTTIILAQSLPPEDVARVIEAILFHFKSGPRQKGERILPT